VLFDFYDLKIVDAVGIDLLCILHNDTFSFRKTVVKKDNGILFASQPATKNVPMPYFSLSPFFLNSQCWMDLIGDLAKIEHSVRD